MTVALEAEKCCFKSLHCDGKAHQMEEDANKFSIGLISCQKNVLSRGPKEFIF